MKENRQRRRLRPPISARVASVSRAIPFLVAAACDCDSRVRTLTHDSCCFLGYFCHEREERRSIRVARLENFRRGGESRRERGPGGSPREGAFLHPHRRQGTERGSTVWIGHSGDEQGSSKPKLPKFGRAFLIKKRAKLRLKSSSSKRKQVSGTVATSNAEVEAADAMIAEFRDASQ